jgi:hypothetical protein
MEAIIGILDHQIKKASHAHFQFGRNNDLHSSGSAAS